MTSSARRWRIGPPAVLVAVAPVLVLLVAYLGWIHPRIGAGSVARARAALLDERLASMGDVVAGGAPRAIEPGGVSPARRFDDPAAVVRALAQSALGRPEPVTNLTVETRDRFVRVAFDSSYARAGRFLWDLRELPMLVDVQSLEVGPAERSSQVRLVLEVGPVAGVDSSALPGQSAQATVDVTTAPVWGRNPFETGARQNGDRVAGAGAPAVADPVVRSILYSAGRQVALVDDRIVSVGAEVSAGRIVEIEPEAIVIDAPGGEQRRIELSRPALPALRP